MNIVEKYVGILEQDKAGLENYLKENIGRITFPESPEINPIPTVRKEPPINVENIAIGAGVAGIVGGIVCGGTGGAIAAVAGAVVAGAALISKKKKQAVKEDGAQPEMDYYQVTRSVYENLASIRKHLFNTWESSTTTVKNHLKSELNKLDLSENIRSRAIQSVLGTSVIEISLLDVSKDLGRIEQSKDLAAYKQYLHTFEKDCIRAIQKAFDEQVGIYNSLNTVLR